MQTLLTRNIHLWESQSTRVTHGLGQNYDGYWIAIRPYFLFFLAAVMCDAGSTTYFMLNYNLTPNAELHPLFQLFMWSYGPVIGPFVGAYTKAISALVITLYSCLLAKVVLVLATLISMLAAWYNIWVF